MTGSRKRRQSAELPLFDLPLQSGDDPAAGAAATAQGPSVLYDEESAAEDESQGLIDIEAAADEVATGPSIHGEESAAGAEMQLELTAPEPAADKTPEDRALLGDRLLGGLADLAVQLLMLGLAITASLGLGVAVSPADWMPFAVLTLVFSFLYWAVPLAFWGQTPGMAWVGHTARTTDGEPLAFSQTFRRWLGAILTLALAGLPLLLALTGRSFTDRLSASQTVVE